ncbi:hypothetical protein [Iningainema tapete]|uniref:Uncharacterized protein n=1 Tax=Iningainema tapete BLCC-T55 TaxID=2748662 RepID=A0A8J6XS54_9CYAN|nr:hypothetical protein [Iningainema tapete]MBD2775597.1 hypothetical protein [Iningainema tapete BLCC-T55]
MRLVIKQKLLSLLLLLTNMQPAVAQPSITVSANSNNSNLNLAGEGNTLEYIVKVATLALSEFGANGFTLTVSLGNSGNLAKADGKTPIPFQVTTVPGGSNPPGVTAFSTPSGNNYTVSSNLASLDLYIKYKPAALQDPGNYGSSLNLDVVDN